MQIHSEERLLQSVGGIRGVAQHFGQSFPEPALVSAHQIRERVVVAVDEPRHVSRVEGVGERPVNALRRLCLGAGREFPM